MPFGKCNNPKGAPFQNHAGRTFGRLTAIEYVGRTKWKCQCSCGNTTTVNAIRLKNGTTSSCGCFRKERARKLRLTHGYGKRGGEGTAWSSWHSMMARCNNPKMSGYHNYGGRGISVCKKWFQFLSFLADMGDRPDGKSLGRIDNNGHYCKSNCRWETRIEQGSNRRDNRFVTAIGLTKTVAEWERYKGVKTHVILRRLNKGWSDEDAVNKPMTAQNLRMENV